MTGMIDRRRLLRGSLAGGTVMVGLPLLDCFLNGNGEAMAADGKPIPVRFGTWFWGLGMNADAFIPKKIGADYDLPEQIAPLKDVKQHINVFTGFDVLTDDAPNICHSTGWITLRCGMAPKTRIDLQGESLDVTIANQIGGATRFRALDVTATGSNRDGHSFRGSTYNTPDASPMEFYQRLFGPEFQDPNGATFTPNPNAMLQRSVLSGVLEQVKAFERKVGAEDRTRLDQYFTGLRDVERQLEMQLQKPEPIAACKVAAGPQDDLGAGLDADVVGKRHRLMADMIVMALACDQTRVFNLSYANAFASTTKKGEQMPHHACTHHEVVDDKLGYQPVSHWFICRAMENWAYLVRALASVPEGAGTLLDNTLVYAHSDQEFAKIHSVTGLPMFTAGRAGGRIRSGLHIAGDGQPATRLPYTMLRTMGVDIPSWGTKSNRVSNPIGEIVA